MLSEAPDFDTCFICPPEDAGQRLDKLLSFRFPLYSRTYFQNLIAKGCVLLDGLPAKKRIPVEEGDEVEVCFEPIPSLDLVPEPIPLEILYEDDFLLAIAKPAGMVVHPAPGHPKGTFANALLAHCEGKLPEGGNPLRPGIVHRLDKETSGVLIAAKTTLAHQRLVSLFAERKVEKTYLAICQGKPKNGVLSAPIGRSPLQRKEMAVLEGGKEAETEFQVLATASSLSLVLAKPKTGRTHQIRVHLKHLGAPILGDGVYGSSSTKGAPRMLLHAYRLFLPHPITGEPLQFTAPLPDDFKEWVLKFGHAPVYTETT